MKRDTFAELLTFLNRLDEVRIRYTLRHSRDDAIMVFINVPGERWEVEFMADGEIEVERFRSDSHIYDESSLAELFAVHSDPPAQPASPLATPASH